MKIYIGTGLENAHQHRYLHDELLNRGHMLTYDWTVHGSLKGQGVKILGETSVLEVNGVLDADLVIIVLPGGRGTHTEMGVALGSNKPVLLVTDKREPITDGQETCIFYHHPFVATLWTENPKSPVSSAAHIIHRAEDWLEQWTLMYGVPIGDRPL